MKRGLIVGVVLFWALMLPVPAHAFDPRAGSSVVVSQPVQDDLYAAGGTVDVGAAVDGDLVAAGGTVSLSGPVSGGILGAGGTVRISGSVGRAVRAAAGNLTVDALIGSDAVLAGGMVVVGRQSQIVRDLVIGGGTIDVAGGVGRNAFLSGGRVVIGGTVQGNVDVQADRLVLLPSARIAGALRYTADVPAEIQSGAQVSGGIQRLPMRQRRPRPGSLFFGFAGRIAELLWLLVVGFVLLALAPGAVWRVSARVGSQFWRNLLVGFVLLVVVPAAAVVMLVTLVGIPLALLVIAVYMVTLYLGQVAVAGWVGALIFSRWRRAEASSPYVAFAIGALVLILLFALPLLGWVIRCFAVLVGFGAFWASAWGLRGRGVSASAPA